MADPEGPTNDREREPASADGRNAPALSVSRLSKRFADRAAFEDVSFDVGRGEVGEDTRLRLGRGLTDEELKDVLRHYPGDVPDRRHVGDDGRRGGARMAHGVDGRGVPLPPRPWRYSDQLIEALVAAAQIHGTQVRKGTTIPYLSHLLGACSIALDYGANEQEAIAALLHDTIEDGEPAEAARATVRSFGDEVARIVEGCTDADTHPKPPWRVRKEAYLARVASEDHSILLVSASDKLHNARAIVRDLRIVGQDLWRRFGASRGAILWYYRSLVTVYRSNPAHTPALIDELDRTVTEMEILARGGAS